MRVDSAFIEIKRLYRNELYACDSRNYRTVIEKLFTLQPTEVR